MQVKMLQIGKLEKVYRLSEKEISFGFTIAPIQLK